MAGRVLEGEPLVSQYPRFLEAFGIHHVEPPLDAVRLKFRPGLIDEVLAEAGNEDIRDDEALLMGSGARYLYKQASLIWPKDNGDEIQAESRKAGIAVAHRILRHAVGEQGSELPVVEIDMADNFTADMRGRPEKLQHWFNAVTTEHRAVRSLINGFSSEAAKEGAKLLVGLFGEFINPELKVDTPGRIPGEMGARPRPVPHGSPRISVSKQARKH